MVDDLQLITELLALVDSKPLSRVDFAPILSKHETGLSFNEQREVRSKFRRILKELKDNGDIAYNDNEVHISVSTGDVWNGSNGIIKSTLKRKEKLEQIEREKPKTHFQTGDIKDSTIIHSSDLRDSPIIHKTITTPNTKERKATWYTSPIFKYLIFPIVVILIGTYLCHLFGWI